MAEDVSFSQLQEMREKSKLLRDQVLSVQKAAQSKVRQLLCEIDLGL